MNLEFEKTFQPTDINKIVYVYLDPKRKYVGMFSHKEFNNIFILLNNLLLKNGYEFTYFEKLVNSADVPDKMFLLDLHQELVTDELEYIQYDLRALLLSKTIEEVLLSKSRDHLLDRCLLEIMDGSLKRPLLYFPETFDKIVPINKTIYLYNTINNNTFSEPIYFGKYNYNEIARKMILLNDFIEESYLGNARSGYIFVYSDSQLQETQIISTITSDDDFELFLNPDANSYIYHIPCHFSEDSLPENNQETQDNIIQIIEKIDINQYDVHQEICTNVLKIPYNSEYDEMLEAYVAEYLMRYIKQKQAF